MRKLHLAALASVLIGFAACAGESTDPAGPVLVGPGESFTLAVGQYAELAGDDLVVRLLEVTRDSRCPRDVTCVWEGDAVAAIEVVYRDMEYAFGLHATPGEATGPGAVEVGGYRIELESVAPEPWAGVTIPQTDYRVTLRIRPGAST